MIADTSSERNNVEASSLIALLPSELQAKARRYRNEQSRINYCFGRLMLLQAIEDLGFDKNKINQLSYSDNDKPFIDGFSFNISHSGDFVALAFSKDCKLALDIESPQEVDLKNFKSFFREDEWQEIQSADNPLQKFYWFWVRKESILKAVDDKMNQVKEIFITTPESGYFQKLRNLWQLQELEIADNCLGVVACDAENVEVVLSEFTLKV